MYVGLATSRKLRAIGISTIGLRDTELVEARTVQLPLYAEDQKRGKWGRIDEAVDHLRRRYGYMSVC